MINPMRQGPTRVMGMMSGMDTESVIQATLRMHQFRIDNQLRNRRVLEWRQEIHNSLRDEITNLRQTFLSNLGPRSMMNRNAFNANAATATGRNSDAVTVRALAGGATGQIRIGEISRLATTASIRTSGGDGGARYGFIGTQGTRRLDRIEIGAEHTNHPFSLEALGFADDDPWHLRVGNRNIEVDTDYIDNINWDEIDFENRFTFQDAQVTVTRGMEPGTLDFTIVDRGGNEFRGTVEFNDDGSPRLTDDTTTPPTNILIDHPPGTPIDERLEPDQLAHEIFSHFTRTGEADAWQFRRGNAAVEFTRTHTMEDRPDITLTQREGESTVLHNGVALDDALYQITTLRINDNDPDNPNPIEIRSNMTINQMVAEVNRSGAGVRMGFETLTGRFTLETTATGENSRLTLDDTDTVRFFQALGMVPDYVPELPIPDDPDDLVMIPTENATTVTFGGRDAELYINGDLVRVANNTFTFGGVSITLNRTTEDGSVGQATGPGDISINVTRDTDDTIARIREFIDAYNAIISRLESLSTERKTGNQASFRPLTDEERRAMSEREVEEWERIARIGIMRGDQGIANLASNLRRSFFEPIPGVGSGAGTSASQIGLTTGNHFDGTGGQIMIDEERLRAALEDDPDMVADLFIRIDDNGQGVGLLHNINDLMRNFVNTNQATSLRGLEESVRRTNEQIERMETRMFAEEERLYRQFAAMETALSRLQQQGDWFAAMLGG